METTPGPLASLDLDNREGWPPELRVLLERFPRTVWFEHDNLGQMARFWLDIHREFRRLGRSLTDDAGHLHDGTMPAADFRAVFGPRLSYFLSGLQSHHRIEDIQFFPLFAAAEPRLVRGFDVLERDHEAIHETMMEVVATTSELWSVPETDDDRMRKVADRHADSVETLLRRLLHHLDDEEDLIIPLILDRGESPLGL